MVLGGLLVLAGYILAGLANDSVPQSRADDVRFGEITCRRLEVVDDEGNKSVRLYANEHGGAVKAYGKDGGQAALYTNEHGGAVSVKGKDGGQAELQINENGGGMAIYNKVHENVLQASVEGKGGGIIRTYDKSGNRTGRLGERELSLK